MNIIKDNLNEKHNLSITNEAIDRINLIKNKEGKGFLRISVDHGPNESMIGQNKSNTKSLENIFKTINLIS